MAYVLSVIAGKFGNPVTVFVFMETCYGLFHKG